MHIIANELVGTFYMCILFVLYVCSLCILFMLTHASRILNLKKLLLLLPLCTSWQPTFSMRAWSNCKTSTHM